MSVSLPSFAIFPGVPAGTPLAPGAEGLAAFGTLPGNPGVASAFGSVLSAATAAPTESMPAAVATQDGLGNPTTLAMPDGMSPPAGPAAQTAMPVPFHWNPAEETTTQTTPDLATNEGLTVELGMNAGADCGDMPTTTAEPATTNVSAETTSGETVAPAPTSTEAQPKISGGQPEAPTACFPTGVDPDTTAPAVPVAPARAQARRPNPTVPQGTKSTVGIVPAAAFSTPAAALTSAGRQAIAALKTGANATPSPLTGGWRNVGETVVQSASVAASTVASDAIVPVIATPVATSPVFPVIPAALPSVSASAVVAPAQAKMPVSQTAAVIPTPVADIVPPTATEQPIFPGVEAKTPSGEKPSVGRGPTMPVAVPPTPTAQPVVMAAAVPAIAVVASSQPVIPVTQPVVPATTEDISSPNVTAQPVAPCTSTPEFPVVLSDVAQTTDLPAELPAPTHVALATAPAAPIAAMVMPTPPPMPVAVPPVALGNPVSAGQGMGSTPVMTPGGMTNPFLPLAALPVAPATPAIEPAAAASAQPDIFEQQILTAQTEPRSSVVRPVSVPLQVGRLAVPPAVTTEIPSGVANTTVDALPIVIAPATTGNLAAKTSQLPMLATGTPTTVAQPTLTVPTTVAPATTGILAAQTPTLPTLATGLPTTIAQPTLTVPTAVAPATTESLAVKTPELPTLATGISTTIAQPTLAVPTAIAPATTEKFAAKTPELPTSATNFSTTAAQPTLAVTTAVAPATTENFAAKTPELPTLATGIPTTVAQPTLAVPTAVAPAATENFAAKTPDFPTSATGIPPTTARPQPVITAVNPEAIATAFDATAVPSTFGAPQITSLPETTLPSIQMPVVDIAPVTATETTSTDAAADVRRLDCGQVLPIGLVTAAAASSVQFLPTDSASSDIKPALSANRVMPVPVAVSTLPVSVAEVPLPVPPPISAAANFEPAAVTPDTLAPTVDTLPVLSGQEVPVPVAVPPVVEASRATPVTVSSVPVAEAISGPATSQAVASEISPIKTDGTKPVVAPGSRPIRKGKRPSARKIPAPTAAMSVPASTPLMSAAVAPTAVANTGIPATPALFAPTVNPQPVVSDPITLVRSVVPPAVLPATETSAATDADANVVPQHPRIASATTGGNLASALAASLNAIPAPVAPESVSQPTGVTSANEDMGNWNVSAARPSKVPAAGILPSTPMDFSGISVNLAPAAVAPAGLPEDSSPVSVHAVSVGTTLPATVSVAAFSALPRAASNSPVEVLPSAEEVDQVASDAKIPSQTEVRMRPTAEAVVARNVAASAGLVAETMPSAVTANARRLPGKQRDLDSLVTPATRASEYQLPLATATPPAVGQAADVKPEATPAFSRSLPTSDTATTPLPAPNSGEEQVPLASAAADPDTSSAAEIPVAGELPEKFAVPVATDRAEQGGGTAGFSVKNTIELADQQEEKPTAHAGINAAKKSGTMLSEQPQTSSAAPTSKSPAPVADTATRVEAPTITAAKPEPSRTEWVQSAGRTLAIVRDVAERMQTTANRVVEFDVSSQPGTQLSVRLEYRGGVVHTTFRTDSTELRDMLNREWQSTMPSAVTGERSVRLAEPTFTPASTTRGESQSFDLGGQTPRQQQQDTPQSQGKAAANSEFAFARGTTTRRATVAAPAADTTVASTLKPDTAQHLHAFA